MSGTGDVDRKIIAIGTCPRCLIQQSSLYAVTGAWSRLCHWCAREMLRQQVPHAP